MSAVKPAPNRLPYPTAQSEGLKSIRVVSPVGGLNFRDPLPMMGPTDAVALDNFIVKPSAVQLRAGFSAHYTQGTTAIGSILSFQSGNYSDHRLFAGTPGSLIDITNGDTPTTEAEITAVDGDTTGYWSYVNYSMQANKYLLAVNNGAGYWVYSPIEGWTKQTIEGLPNDKLTSITVWQNRVWVTVEGYSSAFYFGIGEILTGATASEFDYGPMFKRGGNAQVIASWSHDSGTGPDDYQVILSTGGDAVVYKGIDPDNAETYALVGTWYIGNIPKGDKFISKMSGDLYIMSDMGIISMVSLTSGKMIENGITSPIIGKVFPLFASQISNNLYDDYWELKVLPWLDIMIISAPQRPNGLFRQLVQCLSSGQWSTFTGMPILSSEIHDREYYFADKEGKVYIGFSSDLDNETEDGEGGTDVIGSIITSYTDFGVPTSLKRFLLIKPMFLGSTPPHIAISVLVDYKDLPLASGNENFPGTSANWDISLWDDAKWVKASSVYTQWYGAEGVGYVGAIKLQVKGNRKTSYVGSLLSVEVGGLM